MLKWGWFKSDSVLELEGYEILPPITCSNLGHWNVSAKGSSDIFKSKNSTLVSHLKKETNTYSCHWIFDISPYNMRLSEVTQYRTHFLLFNNTPFSNTSSIQFPRPHSKARIKEIFKCYPLKNTNRNLNKTEITNSHCFWNPNLTFINPNIRKVARMELRRVKMRYSYVFN